MANNFSTNQKYLDLAGLQLFCTKVKAYILTQGTKIEAQHTADDKVWVNVTVGEAGENGITYTIDDTAINTKFTGIDNRLTTIEAKAGVTGVKIVDVDNTEDEDFVKLTYVGTKDKDGNDTEETKPVDFVRGDVTITLDNTKLDAKITDLGTADSNEAASRKADVELLAGDKYTAGTAGAVGSWAAEGSPTYKSITALSNRLDEINANVVTKVTEGTSTENYVTLEIAEAKAEGSNDTAVTVTINDAALNTKISEMDTAHNNEVTARKAADALLAGDGWDATNGNGWLASQEPSYATIAKLSQQLVSAEGKIDALSSATHFRGVVTALPESALENLDYGDIIIVQADGASKEYIYNADPEAEGHVYSKDNWVELGDTKEEETRLSYLETWVGDGGATGSYITNADINAMFVDGWNLPKAPANRQ